MSIVNLLKKYSIKSFEILYVSLWVIFIFGGFYINIAYKLQKIDITHIKISVIYIGKLCIYIISSVVSLISIIEILNKIIYESFNKRLSILIIVTLENIRKYFNKRLSKISFEKYTTGKNIYMLNMGFYLFTFFLLPFLTVNFFYNFIDGDVLLKLDIFLLLFLALALIPNKNLFSFLSNKIGILILLYILIKFIPNYCSEKHYYLGDDNMTYYGYGYGTLAYNQIFNLFFLGVMVTLILLLLKASKEMIITLSNQLISTKRNWKGYLIAIIISSFFLFDVFANIKVGKILGEMLDNKKQFQDLLISYSWFIVICLIIKSFLVGYLFYLWRAIYCVENRVSIVEINK